MNPLTFNARRAVLTGALFLLAACSDWRRDVTVGGVRFERVRVNDHGLAIGQIDQDTRIGDRLCKRGWVHLHPNGVAAAFTAAEPVVLGKLTLPVDTWIHQDGGGTILACALPRTTEVQGHRCRGTGGPTGVRVAFYPSGALKVYFPVRDEVVDGVPCRANVFEGWIKLHENGRLASCLLDENLERDGRLYPRGTRVDFDEAGHVVSPDERPGAGRTLGTVPLNRS